MKTTKDLQKDAITDLAWKELIQAIKPRDISVSVINGSVKLSGTVEDYSKKILAEQIVSSVTGVKSIINTIEVKLPGMAKRKDEELTDAILDALVKNFDETSDDFSMTIENDWLIVKGDAETLSGKKVPVQGKVCKLEQINTKSEAPSSYPAIITTNEIAYWEIFG